MTRPAQAKTRPPGPKHRRRILLALVLAVALALGLMAAGGGAGTRPADPPASVPTAETTATSVRPSVASVRIDLGQPGPPVPRRFLGLSFEASVLPLIATYGRTGDLVNLMRSLGPGILRFGGVSADTRVAWSDPATPKPAWAAGVVHERDLLGIGRLARATGWQVLLTLGLAHYDPHAAARETAAARRALGPALAGIEIGNEPDAYVPHHLRGRGWGYPVYNGELRSYRTAIAKLGGAIPLAGPGVSGSSAFHAWAVPEVGGQRPSLLTGHHYPLGCHQTPPPSIARLLGEATRRLEGASLNRYMVVARASHLPFRMDEAGSVSCGGRAGISNTFASTLWATGYIAEAMAAGLAGINLQGSPFNCLGYSPVCATSPERLARGALGVQPVWYALLLTRGLVGDRPLPTTVSSRRARNLRVTAFLASGGSLRFVIVDDEPLGAPAAAVRLQVGSGFGSATVMALSAPSPRSRSGVTLGGGTVAPDGTWQASAGRRPIAQRGGIVTVTVPPSSGALVTVQPARLASPARPRPTRSGDRTAPASGRPRGPGASPPGVRPRV